MARTGGKRLAERLLAPTRPYVFDASRLVWRLWRARLPTGIDRVCLAYLDEFAGDALAMLQWRGHRVVLGTRHSQALFGLLRDGAAQGLDRAGLIALLARAVPLALVRPPAIAGAIYLNVGHTGLDSSSLPGWLKRQGLRPVYLIHDLIPITHPQFCRMGEDARHARRIANALGSAAGIIVNSAATGDALAQFARSRGLPVAPLAAAHLGIDPLTQAALPSPHDRAYFLCLGTIEARKNHLLLLRLWDRLRADLGPDAPDLVLIGQRGWEVEQVFAALDAGPRRIIELSQCSDAALAAWIDHARALVMPSHAEGYGLPVIEALARTTPVIASDLAVYRELAGTIPLLIDADDEAAWLAALHDYLTDTGDRARQLEALAGYRPPRWAAHMAQVRRWLEGL